MSAVPRRLPVQLSRAPSDREPTPGEQLERALQALGFDTGEWTIELQVTDGRIRRVRGKPPIAGTVTFGRRDLDVPRRPAA